MHSLTMVILLVVPTIGAAQTKHPQGKESLPPSEITISDTTLRDWIPLESASRALGLVPLRTLVLAKGESELRLWQGMSIGVPIELVRVRRRGTQIDGLLGRFWYLDTREARQRIPGPTIDSILRFDQSGQCGRFRRYGEVEGCVVRTTRHPPWQSLWDSLVRLNTWSLPNQASLPDDGVMVADGDFMIVELRNGANYRSFAYSNPRAHKQREQQLARAVMQAPVNYWALVPPSPHTRVFRGRLDFRLGQRATFTLCGAKDAWEANGGLVDWWGEPQPLDSMSVSSYFAVLRATLEAPGVAASRDPPHKESIYVDSIITHAPWGPKLC